jgi:anthranilate synthase component 1
LALNGICLREPRTIRTTVFRGVLAEGRDSYLLESVEGGETWGRYSIIGLPCQRRYTVRGNTLLITDNGRLVSEETVSDPLARIAELKDEFNIPQLDELPLFSGGLVGFFAYETVRLIEPRLAGGDKKDELGTADIELLLSEEVAVLDNLEGRLWLIVHADPAQPEAWEQAQRRLEILERGRAD